MAKGRMLKKEITTSERINSLSDRSALLYTWCIPFQDDFGLLWASSWKLKNTVVPGRKTITQGIIGRCLTEWISLGIVCLVKIEKETWLWFPDFEEKQTLKKDRKPQTYLGRGYEWSFYKEIPQIITSGKQMESDNFQMEDNGFQMDTEEKGREGKRREEKRSENTPLGSEALTFNNKLFEIYKEITGESPKDDPKARLKYPRLIRQKFKDLEVIRDAIKWGWDLKNKQGEFYWRGRMTLEKLYCKILPAYLEDLNAKKTLKTLAEAKKDLLKMPK